MTYQVTKTYGHDVGLSATFRQWRAESHCRFLHGYALAVKLTFECERHQLDQNGWVINFGMLKPVKAWLESMLDHKTLVAKDDPMLWKFQAMSMDGLIQLVEVERTGCEAFAKMIYEHVQDWLMTTDRAGLCELVEVEVREHGANSAILKG